MDRQNSSSLLLSLLNQLIKSNFCSPYTKGCVVFTKGWSMVGWAGKWGEIWQKDEHDPNILQTFQRINQTDFGAAGNGHES